MDDQFISNSRSLFAWLPRLAKLWQRNFRRRGGRKGPAIKCPLDDKSQAQTLASRLMEDGRG